MVRKIIKYTLVVLGIGLLLFLVLHNLDSFVASTHRLGEILKIDSLRNWFEVYNDTNTVIYDESIQEIETNVNTFIEYAKQHPELRFHIRKVGYDKAGYTIEQIAPLFNGAKDVTNILLPREMISTLNW